MLGIEWKKRREEVNSPLSKEEEERGEDSFPLFLLIKTGRREVYRIMNGGEEKGRSNLYCSLREESETGCGL